MNWEIFLLIAVVLAASAFLWLEIRNLRQGLIQIHKLCSNFNSNLYYHDISPSQPPPSIPSNFSNPAIVLEKTIPSRVSFDNHSEGNTETTSQLEEELAKCDKELEQLEPSEWEEIDGNSLKSDEIAKLEALTKLDENELEQHEEDTDTNFQSSLPSEAFSSQSNKKVKSEEFINEHLDLDEPGDSGDELIETLLHNEPIRTVMVSDGASTVLDDLSEGRSEYLIRISKDYNLENLRNLCRHYGCSVKGNKKELVHKLLLKDGFLHDYLNHNLPKFGGVGQTVVVKHE